MEREILLKRESGRGGRSRRKRRGKRKR